MIISKLYNKNHLIFILVIFIGFIYSLYKYFNYEKIINEYLPIEKIVIGQSCKPYTKLVSSIVIEENGKKYNVELYYNECIKYPKFSKIRLLYNNKKDEFLYPLKSPKNNRNVLFLGIILLISIIPWTYLLKLTNSNKGKK